jgi:hypothetical protein
LSISATKAVDFTDKPKLLTFELHRQPISLLLVPFEFHMKSPTCVDTLIGDSDKLDIFQVEESLTIGQGVERMDSQWL